MLFNIYYTFVVKWLGGWFLGLGLDLKSPALFSRMTYFSLQKYTVNYHTYLQDGICGYHSDVPVAVKTLSSRKPEDLEKFEAEVELMKRFTHPKIVSLLG